MRRSLLRWEWLLCVAAVVLGVAGSAQAAWQMVDNFTSESTTATIAGQQASGSAVVWGTYSNPVGSSSAVVVSNSSVAPLPFLQLSSGNIVYGSAYLPLVIPASTTATLFYQVQGVSGSGSNFSTSGNLQDISGGMSYGAAPTAYSAYQGVVGLDAWNNYAGVTSWPIFKVFNLPVGGYSVLTQSVSENIWYDVWQVYHTGATQASGSYDVYIAAAANPTVILSSSLGIPFRNSNSSTGSLTYVTFAGDKGISNIANVYLDPTEDNHLTTPFSQVSGVSVAVNLNSNGFNSQFWVSPSTYAIAKASGSMVNAVFPSEPTNCWTIEGGVGNGVIQVLDGNYVGTYGANLTGSNGFLASGSYTSISDSRPYYLPSLSGNSLYPGDQVEITNSNCILVGEGASGNHWVRSSATIAMPAISPSSYKDINFVLTSGGAEADYPYLYFGPEYLQIWAVYTTTGGVNNSTSALLYDFGEPTLVVAESSTIGPPVNGQDYANYAAGSTTASDFNILYTSYGNMNESTWPTDIPGRIITTQYGTLPFYNIYEFKVPRALDTTRTLQSIQIIDTKNGTVDNAKLVRELVIFGATATTVASSAPTVTLTTAVSPAGDGSVTPSGGVYSPSSTLSVTANANAGYQFANWSLTVPGGASLNNYTANPAVLTFGLSNCTLTADVQPVYTLSLNTGSLGTATVTPSGPQPSGTPVTVVVSTVSAGQVFNGWTVTSGTVGNMSNSLALTSTMTIVGNCTLTANYVAGSYVNNLNPNATDGGNGSLATPFLTISHATGLISPGQTIVVLQGVYRGKINLVVSGTSVAPCVLRSNPGDRVVLDGADLALTGSSTWTPLTSATSSGNPSYANIYWTNISWSPTWVFEDGVRMTMAQTPSTTWWVPTAAGSGSDTLIDTVNLTQTDSNYWVGSLAGVYDLTSNGLVYTVITGYTPSTNTITSGFGFNPGPTNAVYFIANTIHALTGPGQYICLGSGSNYQLFVWPFGSDRPDGHLVEASRYGGVSQANPDGIVTAYPIIHGFWTFNGLEVCNSTGNGFGFGNYPSVSNVVIENCVVHDNGGPAIYNSGINGFYIHNLLTYNGGGVPLAGGMVTHGFGMTGNPCNATIQENEICFNGDDGLFMSPVPPLLVVGNFIHDHWATGWHPDNMQFETNGPGFTFSSNLIMNGADVMMNAGGGSNYTNNIFTGIANYMFGDVNSNVMQNNTLAAFGYKGPYSNNFTNQTWDNNISCACNMYNQPYAAFGWASGSASLPYASDYNLFYGYPGVAGTSVGVPIWNSGYNTLATYQASSSQDTHSQYGNPQFAVCPTFAFQVVDPKNEARSPSFVYLTETQLTGSIAVNDNIEIGCDGVSRQVKAVSGYIEFSPSDIKFATGNFNGIMFDWKSSSNTSRNLDLTPSNSFALANGVGSNIKIQDYMAGKLNGATSRVLPTWPIASVNVTSWAASIQGTAGFGVIQEGNTLTSPVAAIQVVFSGPVNPLTVNSATVSGITIVNQTSGGAVAIASATLDTTGTILTVTPSSALTANQNYEFILNPTLFATNGGMVLGTKSVAVRDN